MPILRKIQTGGAAALSFGYSYLFLMLSTIPQNLQEAAVSWEDDSSLIFLITIYVISAVGLLYICFFVVFIRGTHGRRGIHFIEARAAVKSLPLQQDNPADNY